MSLPPWTPGAPAAKLLPVLRELSDELGMKAGALTTLPEWEER